MTDMFRSTEALLSRYLGMKIWPAPDHSTAVQTKEPAGIPGFLSFARRIFTRAAIEFLNDDIPTVAAGATFYILLAVFPAIAAFVSLYGLFADVHTAGEHLSYLRGFLPADVLRFVGDEMIRLTTTLPSKLSGAFLLSLLVSIWSANAGISSLLAGLNIAYEQRETRGFVKTHLISLALTIAALIGAMAAIFLLVAIPYLQASLGLASLHMLGFFRWPLTFLGTLAILAAIYSYGPNRTRRENRRVLPGALFASSVWLLVAWGFALYLRDFAHYGRTYGSLATMMGFLMWVWLGLMVILFGAELNCELERPG